ncbi:MULTISPECIES: PTS sugar transporter subunit IIA [unclassified Enterococcus]|jgi:mannose/fructose-specific phosphotransferase system component IIA|uniref:PTS sugar transporter subunit IIA n=1 Tax=unclassified Enterococcus TaxID=2608891 RepID=UPI003D2A4C0B
MKISVLLVSHSGLAEGMKKAAEFIAGEQENFYAVELDADGIEKFRETVKKRINEAMQTEEWIIISDIPSGSPGANVLDLAVSEKLLFKMYSGMNLALVLETLLSRENKTSEALAKDAILTGKESIVDMLTEEEDEEEFF